jgi:hypothetical protein
MTDILKICGAAGLGVYTSLGLHFHSILVSHTKSDLTRFISFFLFLVLFIGGGLIGSGVIASSFAPSAWYWRGAVLLMWVGIVWIYIMLNWRALKQRLSRST